MIKRTSLNLDFELVRAAKTVLGTTETTETVHRALREVVRREKLERLLARDFEPGPHDWLRRPVGDVRPQSSLGAR
jgi:Arc/MetJ family transcription regulator